MFATWDYCLSPGSSAERSSVFFFMEPSFFLIEACAVDSAGSFLPQSLVCRTVHKLPAALTPDMCNPHVSTQTPSSSGRNFLRESLIVSLGSRQQVLQVWWRSSWRWNLNCLVFSNIIMLNDAAKQQSHHQVVRSCKNIAVSPGQPIFLNCALYISHIAAGDEFQGPPWSSEVMRKVQVKHWPETPDRKLCMVTVRVSVLPGHK